MLKIYWKLSAADLFFFFPTGLDTIWSEKDTEIKSAEKTMQDAEKEKVQREAPTDDDDDYEPKLTPGWSLSPDILQLWKTIFFVSKVFFAFFSSFGEWWWLQWSTWEWGWRIQSDKNQKKRQEGKSDQERENQTDSCLQKRQTSLKSIKVKITSSRFVVLVESRFVCFFFFYYYFFKLVGIYFGMKGNVLVCQQLPNLWEVPQQLKLHPKDLPCRPLVAHPDQPRPWAQQLAGCQSGLHQVQSRSVTSTNNKSTC